jgi:uncharacterized protein YecE (DUF72 family)
LELPLLPSTAELPLSPPHDELVALAAALPPELLFGTSSWTYPGWHGLIYRRRYPETGRSVAMLAEYVRYPLFRTVGVDSSFYRPPAETMLRRYASVLPPRFPCVSKVWDRLTVQTVSEARDRRRPGEPNPDFLDADLFREAMYEPYRAHFGDHTGPFVFEFRATASGEGLPPARFIDRLDRFFERLPRDARYAVELRDPAYLIPAYFAVLRQHNVAHVFNSWTRMPSIGRQLDHADAITADFVVARILLPPGRTYEEARAALAPFNAIPAPDLTLRQDVLRLLRCAVDLRIPGYILVNNKAEGSAPLTIAALARAIVER